MINIADNPLVLGQVKQANPAGTAPDATHSPGAPPDQPGYPAKSMVLEGGRYYVEPAEK